VNIVIFDDHRNTYGRLYLELSKWVSGLIY